MPRLDTLDAEHVFRERGGIETDTIARHRAIHFPLGLAAQHGRALDSLDQHAVTAALARQHHTDRQTQTPSGRPTAIN